MHELIRIREDSLYGCTQNKNM